jgi:hypothetical protein
LNWNLGPGAIAESGALLPSPKKLDPSIPDSEPTRPKTSRSIEKIEAENFPQVLLATRLDQNYLMDDVSRKKISEWREWVRNMPPGAKDLKIIGIYERFPF